MTAGKSLAWVAFAACLLLMKTRNPSEETAAPDVLASSAAKAPVATTAVKREHVAVRSRASADAKIRPSASR